MRAEEIRELTDAEVGARILELQEERFRLRFRAATETLEDPLRLRVIRKDIARMQTVLRERELAKLNEAAPSKSAGKKTAKAGKTAKSAKARKSARAATGVRRGVAGSKASRAMRRGYKARATRQQER